MQRGKALWLVRSFSHTTRLVGARQTLISPGSRVETRRNLWQDSEPQSKKERRA